MATTMTVPDGYREVSESEVPEGTLFYWQGPGMGRSVDSSILHRDDDGTDRYFVRIATCPYGCEQFVDRDSKCEGC